MAAARTFVLIANRPTPSGEIPLNDLAGAGGRFDLVARFVTASLLTSHSIREDTEAIVFFANQTPEPVALKARGKDAVGLRPDERSTAARLLGVLDATPMPVWQDIAAGFAIRTLSLETLLDELQAPVHLMSADGDPLASPFEGTGSFVLGDQDELTTEQRDRIGRFADHRTTVGPVALQADQVVTVLHNRLDRSPS